MKRLLAALMLLCLTACAPAGGEAAKPILTADEYPRVDGSTANFPMMAAIRAKTTGVSQEEAEAVTTCRKTSEAWLGLANGVSDLLLVYEASEGTKEELAQIGTELVTTPIGRDALVFIVNADNPVQSLTQAQLTDIYTGKLTNWKQVGGSDLPIVAFQRPEASGSQSLFIKLLMGHRKPMAAPTELRPTEMGGLIDELASYDNSQNALGYSVFYYASYMYEQPGLRFVAVDGVLPSDETIADGSYPLLNEYYLVTRVDTPEDSPTAKLRDWILSDEGRETIRQAGYIPLD